MDGYNDEHLGPMAVVDLAIAMHKEECRKWAKQDIPLTDDSRKRKKEKKIFIF